MRSFDINAINTLQRRPSFIRNICIVAHVDHGKTTLADSLVASNGIISSKMAGKLRYLDSRKDEQLRGITMKSSAISIVHTVENDQYLINLIDSPGHVDFSHEVSTGVRLSDGAILVVDVVEGVCPQTKLALVQAWQENIRPVLVLNKIDRLILELKLTPLDAYVKLTQVLEQVNAIMGELFVTEVITKSERVSELEKNVVEGKLEDTVKDTSEWSDGLEEADDENLYFTPERGNVAFASAYDGWAFRIKDFASIYAAKIGIKSQILEKTLWGDYFLNTKAKRIQKGAQMKAKKPLFVQLVLENLWALYEVIAIRRDKEKLEKILTTLGIKIATRDMRHTDPKVQLQAVCSSWLPLSKAVLDMVCGLLPPPSELSVEKAETLMCLNTENFSHLPAETQALREAFTSCDSSESAPVIVYISKMCPVDKKLLPENKQKLLTLEEMAERRRIALEKHAARLAGEEKDNNEQEEDGKKEEKDEEDVEDTFVAFARIFSGTLREGQEVFVLGPKHDPDAALKNPDVVTNSGESNYPVPCVRIRVPSLYLLMGRDLHPIKEIPAGNLLGIGGLHNYVLNTATISSTIACPSFSALRELVKPILRVAIEPKCPQDLPKVVRGLKLLNQADGVVEVRLQETGEMVVLTVGEVHLERCLEDLKERYAKVPINVSEPIVPFRETVIVPPIVDMVNETIDEQSAHSKESAADKGLIEMLTPNKQCRILLRAIPLPLDVTSILERDAELIRLMESNRDVSLPENINSLSLIDKEEGEQLDKSSHHFSERTLKSIAKFKTDLERAFKNAGDQWVGAFEKIWCFGPRRYGPNILFNYIKNYDRSVWANPAKNDCGLLSQYNSSFTNGFQLATLAGPLCEEPMMGVGFLIEDWQFVEETSITGTSYGPLSGQILSSVKEGCRKAFQAQPQRLMMAMYSCSILVNADVLGKMYAVLGRRHGRVLYENMTQSTATFAINAVLPVVESFSFAPEMRKQTSGLASPQLLFSHWEVLDVDPFWTPRTEEEYLHFGEKADSENRARRYMNAVRRRKGLHVEEKLVEFAEKQRTLSKNK